MLKINNKSISSVYDETTSIGKIMKGTLKVYEAWRKLIASGVPPFTIKTKGGGLINYTITGNSIQNGTPTPDTPIEVESVGEKTSNLYDFTDTSQLEKLDYSTTAQRWGFNLGFLPAGDYTISFELVDENDVPNSVYIRQKKADGTVSSAISLTTTEVRNNPARITATGDTEYYFMFASGSVTTLAHAIERVGMFKWIKIEKGKVATAFEPFGYKIPIKATPTIYEFKPENIGLQPLTDTDTRYGFDLGVLEQGDYVINIDFGIPEQFVEYLYLRYRDKDGNYSDYIYVTTMSSFIPRVFNADGSSHYYLYFASKLVGSLEIAKEEWKKVKGAFLQKGTTFEQREVNVYTKESLKKMGNYEDTIDFKTGETKNVLKEVVLTGKESWILITDNGYNRYAITIKDSLIGNKSACLCTHFPWKSVNGTDNTFVLGGNTLYAYFRYDTVADIAGWKAYLAEQYANGTPVKLYYPLAEPKLVESEHPTILTYKGTNVIDVYTNLLPSNMEIIYYGKPIKELLLGEETNDILNAILASDTQTILDISDVQINQMLDEIIGG